MRIRIYQLAALATLALGLAVLPVDSARAAGSEFTLPNTASAPTGIVSGPGGNLWFTEQEGACAPNPDSPGSNTGTCGAIGEMDPSGHLLGEFPLPSQGTAPTGIIAGRDGALWFAESGSNAIGRLDPGSARTGTSAGISEYPTPTVGSQPTGITAGPDGALWFTEHGYNDGNRIGRLDPSQASPGTQSGFSEFCIRGCAMPAMPGYAYQGLEPTGIVAGPDGRLWFTETNPYCSDPNLSQPTTCDPYDNGSGNDDGIGEIGAITTSGAVSEYRLPNPSGQTPNSQPLGLAAGPDGALWFTEYNHSEVGRIPTSGGQISEYLIPGSDTQPTGIASGPDGQLWFALSGQPGDGANRLAEIDPRGASPGTSAGIGLFPELTGVQNCSTCAQGTSYPDGLTAAGGAVWFTELLAGRIGSQPPGPTTAPPPPPPTQTQATIIYPPPLVIQEPGEPASPILSTVHLSDRRFLPTVHPTDPPSSARRARCKVKRPRHSRRRHLVCKRAPPIQGLPRGTEFVFTLNAPASVSIAIYSPGNAHTRGTLAVQAKPGRDAVPFTGWLRGRRLRPGRYEAELVARNVAGTSAKTHQPFVQTSRPVTVQFQVQ